MGQEIYLDENSINEIEKCLEYNFNNKNLLSVAFRRCTITNQRGKGNIEKNKANNEVLEFLGDKLIYQCIVMDITKKEKGNYKDDCKACHSEAEYTRFVNYYTNKKYLSKLVDKYELKKYMIIVKENEISEKTKCDLFEAIIGAVWIDSNMNISKVSKVIHKLIEFEYENPERYKKNKKQIEKEENDKTKQY